MLISLIFLSPNVQDIAELRLFYFKNCIYLDGSGFYFQQRQGIFLFSKTFRPALGSTQPPIQWTPQFSSSGVRQPRPKFNHFRLVLKLKMSGTIRLLTPYVSIAWTSTTLPYTFTYHVLQTGAWGSVVVKALCYQSGGPGIDSRWCHLGSFPWLPTEPCALGSTQPLKMSAKDFS